MRKQTIYSTEQETIDFDAPETGIPATEQNQQVSESPAETPASYTIGDGWRTTADNKLRGWVLYNPDGTKLAEITTKSGAQKIIDLLNGKEGILR